MRKATITASALASVLALTLTACGGSLDSSGDAAPGVTDKTITIGAVQAWGGDFSDPVNKSYEGMQAWINFVNAHGGIHGRKIVVKKYDHKETAEGGVAACRQLVSDNDVLMSTEFQGQIAHVTTANCLDNSSVPNIVWQGSDDYLNKWSHTFALLPTPSQMGVTTAKYVRSRVSGDAPVGLVYVNQDAYKVAGDAFIDEAKDLGVNLVATEPISYTQSSYVPQLERLRAAGVKHVVLLTLGQETAMLTQAKKIGYAPKWTGSQFVFEYAPQAKPGLYEGVTGLKLTSAAPSSKTYDDFKKIYEKYGSGKYPEYDPDTMLSYGFANIDQIRRRQIRISPGTAGARQDPKETP
ncbi:ABC transporter substrate-binding protein [Streptomyces massasporeus]|uniref:ABC transporter substrate-binding protein n=1 Tax=Streptomyces massasporeus TaxID=67324 RepID=UPI003453FAE5